MWVVAEYEATALFSLKPATATASGGRTLLVPTPFAIKMALLDVACRVEGVSIGESVMSWLSAAQIALQPPQRIVVNNTFIKILRPRRNPAQPGTADAGFFQRTISYREYAQLDGSFSIAISVPEEQLTQIQQWLMYINYLGKRGSFIQVQGLPVVQETLSDMFIVVDGNMADSFPLGAIMTQLDDSSDDLDFEKVSIYSGKSLRLGKDRLLQHVALPYRLVSSSRGYSYYERMS